MLEGRKRFRGKLAGIEGDSILLDVPRDGAEDPERVRLPASDLGEARLVLTDELIRESLSRQKHSETATADGHERVAARGN
jgi:ribosome maturation factor RimP